MPHRPAHFQPKALLRVSRPLDTGMGTTEVVTDAGRAFLKVLGNRQGPHNLACEWVGTRLAEWFGLPTADYAILELNPADAFALPRGYRATAGPAFVTRAMEGDTWEQTPEELDALVNPSDITRLVIFDHWTLNCDRHPPASLGRKPNFENVFLSAEGVSPGRRQLVAIDHNNCFTCGRDLTPRIADISWVQKEELYGLFPLFVPRLDLAVALACILRLKEMTHETAAAFVAEIPGQWEVSPGAAAALTELIYRRAGWVADNILPALGFPNGPAAV